MEPLLGVQPEVMIGLTGKFGLAEKRTAQHERPLSRAVTAKSVPRSKMRSTHFFADRGMHRRPIHDVISLWQTRVELKDGSTIETGDSRLPGDLFIVGLW